MHRRHHRLRETDAPSNDLDDRSDAVRGAARARDDSRAISGVNTVDDRLHVWTLRRRRQKDEARSRRDVLLQILAPRERSGTLKHQVDV